MNITTEQAIEWVSLVDSPCDEGHCVKGTDCLLACRWEVEREGVKTLIHKLESKNKELMKSYAKYEYEMRSQKDTAIIEDLRRALSAQRYSAGKIP